MLLFCKGTQTKKVGYLGGEYKKGPLKTALGGERVFDYRDAPHGSQKSQKNQHLVEREKGEGPLGTLSKNRRQTFQGGKGGKPGELGKKYKQKGGVFHDHSRGISNPGDEKGRAKKKRWVSNWGGRRGERLVVQTRIGQKESSVERSGPNMGNGKEKHFGTRK